MIYVKMKDMENHYRSKMGEHIEIDGQRIGNLEKKKIYIYITNDTLLLSDTERKAMF